MRHADEADRATDQAEPFLAAAIRRHSHPLEPGVPGECELCGNDFPRLVRGACVPCRERRGE